MPPQPRPLVLATRNAGKYREIARALRDAPIRLIGPGHFEHIPSPAETGRTFADNARAKAIYYARATGHWCLADDSGLVVDALDGRPGVLSARYAADRCEANADREALDAANNARLLAELEGVDDEKRTARFVCHLAMAEADRILLKTSGAVEGRIARQPRGRNGFGYDPLFVLPDGRTMAELSADRKNAISHRGKAVRSFASLLREMLD